MSRRRSKTASKPAAHATPKAAPSERAPAIASSSAKRACSRPRTRTARRRSLASVMCSPSFPGRHLLITRAGASPARTRVECGRDGSSAARPSMPTHPENPTLGGARVDAPDQPVTGTAEDGLRFLADAGEVLAASLDWETTLVRVAHLAIPTLADWCI